MAKLPDFEGLAMFAKVAEEGSFAAAARAVGVSVATVSRGVEAVSNQVDRRIGQMQVDRHLRICAKKCRQERRDPAQPERHRHR